MTYQSISGFLAGLKPVPLLPVSEWADRNRILSSESSAEPGRWRTARTPYLRQILDDLSPTSPVRRVVVGKAAQLGFTESGLNAVGCYMDISPCPIMYVMPTVDMAKAVSRSRFEKLIEGCEVLRLKIPEKRAKEGGNTILEKSFPGGIVVLTGANSAAGLRSRPIRVLILDEVDAYPLNLDQEGSPIALAEERTNTFGDRKKIYMLSTPTVEGQSVIQRELEQTDCSKFYVPCPECGGVQDLLFHQLRWDEGKPETVHYECVHCEHHINERHKTFMLENGMWVATKPENASPYVKGYHINGLYSPQGMLSWAEIAKRYEDALKDLNKMRTFTNTVLGETYKEEGEAPEWQNLYNRREPYETNKLPIDVCFLTAGVDMQRDRLEIEIVGWCSGKRSYSIDYRVLVGDTSRREVWDELAKVVTEQWLRADGQMLPLRLMTVDSGNNPAAAYDFCMRFDMSRVVPIKGSGSPTASTMISPPRAIHMNKQGKSWPGLKLYTLGVSIIKSELYGWLRQNVTEDGQEPDGYCHFPMYDQKYFRGLTAEQIQWRIVKGYRRADWVQLYDRNEPLDCRVYARAAASILGMDRMHPADWEKLRGREIAKPKAEPKKKPSGGGYLDRWRK